MIIKSSIDFKYKQFHSGNYLFFNFYDQETKPGYNISVLPGFKEGISGNIIVGYNIGINGNSDIRKRDSIKKAFEFLVSKQLQKKFVIKKRIISSILSLYDDEEVCSNVNCEVRKSIQPIRRPNVKDYDEFTVKFRNYIYDYLFNNITDTALEALQKVEDINKVYWVELDDSVLNIISLCVLIMTFSIIILSLIISFFGKFRPYFDFLTFDFWIIVVMGIIIMASSSFLEIGPKTKNKCCFVEIFSSLGSTLTITPILHKLIVNFPQENKISIWCLKHKYFFLLIFCIFDIYSIILLFIPSYSTPIVYIDEGKNYQVCGFYNIGISILISCSLNLKIIIIIIILLLIYIEWNLENTYHDLRLLIIFIYTKIFVVIFAVILDNIEFKNYLNFYLINQGIYIFYSVVSYITFFGIRIFWALKKKETYESKFIYNVNKTFIENENEKFNKEATSEMISNNDMSMRIIASECYSEFSYDKDQSITNKGNIPNESFTINNSCTNNSNSNGNSKGNSKSSIDNIKRDAFSRKASNSNKLFLTLYNYHNQKSLSHDSIQ